MEYLPLGSQMIFWIGLTASSSSSRKPHMVCDFDFETQFYADFDPWKTKTKSKLHQVVSLRRQWPSFGSRCMHVAPIPS
jgi:hypothetical protein